MLFLGIPAQKISNPPRLLLHPDDHHMGLDPPHSFKGAIMSDTKSDPDPISPIHSRVNTKTGSVNNE